MSRHLAINRFSGLNTSRFSHYVMLAWLILFSIAAGCSKPVSNPVIEAKGFQKCTSLKGLGYGDSITPKEKDKVFLVITVDVPTKELLPTEAEYLSLKSAKDTEKTSAGETKTAMPPRENCRIYRSDRFTVVLADGRGYQADLIGRADGSTGYSAHMTNWKTIENNKALPLPEKELMEVAFVVSEQDTKPPFHIQLDRQTPVAVPDKSHEVN